MAEILSEACHYLKRAVVIRKIFMVLPAAGIESKSRVVVASTFIYYYALVMVSRKNVLWVN